MTRLWLSMLLFVAACAPQVQTVGTHYRPAALSPDRAVMEDASPLPLRVWPAEKPAAVLLGVHGFNDYSRAFEMPGEWFAAQGVTFYAFDQRGFGKAPAHGKWAGAHTMIADVRAVAGLLRARHPGIPVFVVGTSMGGAVLIGAAAEENFEADGIILAAPAVYGWSTMNAAYRSILWLSAHVVPDTTLTGRGLGRRPSDNIEMLRALGADPLMIKETRIDAVYGLVDLMDHAYLSVEKVRLPTLLLYGQRDEIVPKEPVKSVAARFGPDMTYKEYEDGWHMLLRDQQREAVWRDMLAWMEAVRVSALAD